MLMIDHAPGAAQASPRILRFAAPVELLARRLFAAFSGGRARGPVGSLRSGAASV